MVIWRDATRQDRPLLQQFQCAEDAGRQPDRRPLPHPRPWEYLVQTWIRTRTPPAGADESLRLGSAESGLLAVGGAALIDGSTPRAIVKLQVVAISVSQRGGDGSLADSVLTEMLDRSVDLGGRAGARETVVTSWVHEDNLPSQQLLRRAGFSNLGPLPSQGQEWVIILR
jgi:hypothetical protein